MLKNIEQGVVADIYETSIVQGGNVLSYICEVTFDKETGTQTIECSNFLINYKPPVTAIDKIGVIVTECIYPLVFTMNETAEITFIENHTDILDRWGKAKDKLYDTYSGKILVDYLTQVEKNIQQEDHLLQSLKKDYFLSLLCLTHQREVFDKENILDQKSRFSFPTYESCTPLTYAVIAAEKEVQGAQENELPRIYFEINAIQENNNVQSSIGTYPDSKLTVKGFADQATKQLQSLEAICNWGMGSVEIFVRKIEIAVK